MCFAYQSFPRLKLISVYRSWFWDYRLWDLAYLSILQISDLLSSSFSNFVRHDLVLFPVAKIYLGHSIALVAFLFWILQLVSGFLLLGLVSYALDVQYAELISIVFHGNFVWLLRMLHMLGANFVVIATIVHFSKSIAFSRVVSMHKFLIWIVGSGIFLLSLGTAFTGYVVVSGNMSFWAALVILNLATVVPALGDEIVAWLLSGSTVNSWSLRRFTVIHFLMGVLALALALLHVVLLHRQNPAKSANDLSDSSETLTFVIVKDLALFLAVLSLLFLDCTKTLVHPDNWQSFSRVVTPAHIEPEIYFLWTFSAIKLHNGKAVGVGLVRNLAHCLS